jgi:hypothetical protein
MTKRFFRRSSVLIVVLVAFQATAIAAEQSQLASCVPALPEGARQVIETKYSNWRILVDSDLNKDDQEIWSRTHRGECPGITSGRFVSPSKADYAVLLVNKQSAHREVRVIVVRSNTSSAYEATAIYSNNQVTNYPVIHTSKPGKYHDFHDRKKFVQIDSDVLIYEHIESRALAFYYKGGKFIRLVISD